MPSAAATTPPRPDFDVLSFARTTRKTLDRLVPFSCMRLPPAPPPANPKPSNTSTVSLKNPILNKILSKVNAYVRTIDDSMIAMQLAYLLSTESMILCDLGLLGPRVDRGDDEEEEEWDVGVSLATLRARATKGLEIIRGVRNVWRDISQDVYKIAAHTKDSNVHVLVPPDPTHADTYTLTLHQIGLDFVANLGLMSQYARAVVSAEEWWQWLKDDLDSEFPTTLYPAALRAELIKAKEVEKEEGYAVVPGVSITNEKTSSDTATTRTTTTVVDEPSGAEMGNAEKKGGDGDGDEARSGLGVDEAAAVTPTPMQAWMSMKETFQDYYNIIHPLQQRFPEPLAPSTIAWREVATAMSRAATPAHSDAHGPISTSGVSSGTSTSVTTATSAANAAKWRTFLGLSRLGNMSGSSQSSSLKTKKTKKTKQEKKHEKEIKAEWRAMTASTASLSVPGVGASTSDLELPPFGTIAIYPTQSASQMAPPKVQMGQRSSFVDEKKDENRKDASEDPPPVHRPGGEEEEKEPGKPKSSSGFLCLSGKMFDDLPCHGRFSS